MRKKCADCGGYFFPENKRHRFCCDYCRKKNWDKSGRRHKLTIVNPRGTSKKVSLSLDSGQRVRVICPRAATQGEEGIVLGTLPSGYVMVALIEATGGYSRMSLDGRECAPDWSHCVYKYKLESLENV